MPKKIIDTKTITRAEWLEYRKQGIGGSDAATVVGLNPYSSKLELWADKVGIMPEKADNEAMRIGRDLEDYVAKRFCEATGKKVKRANAMFAHDEYDFIRADVDRVVVGENAGLECKTTSVWNKSDFGEGEIPLHWLCQCRHYMNVMKFERMYLAVLVLGKGFYHYEIDRDDEEGQALLGAEIDFWNDHVKANVRPAPDGSESAARAMKAITPEYDVDTTFLFGADDLIERREDIQAQIKGLQAQEEALKQQVICLLGAHDNALTERYRVLYGETSRSSIDSKALKADYPELYEKYSKESKTRTLRISDRKDI